MQLVYKFCLYFLIYFRVYVQIVPKKCTGLGMDKRKLSLVNRDWVGCGFRILSQMTLILEVTPKSPTNFSLKSYTNTRVFTGDCHLVGNVRVVDSIFAFNAQIYTKYSNFVALKSLYDFNTTSLCCNEFPWPLLISFFLCFIPDCRRRFDHQERSMTEEVDRWVLLPKPQKFLNWLLPIDPFLSFPFQYAFICPCHNACSGVLRPGGWDSPGPHGS